MVAAYRGFALLTPGYFLIAPPGLNIPAGLLL